MSQNLSPEKKLEEFFREKKEMSGITTISGERYMLVRSESLSFDFVSMVCEIYGEARTGEACKVAQGLIFDYAHALGISDAQFFRKKMPNLDKRELLSVCFLHGIHMGLSTSTIKGESVLSFDKSFFLQYSQHGSCESDPWVKSKKKAPSPVCFWSGAYYSGWCEKIFGVPLVAVEVECLACGDKEDNFVIADKDEIARLSKPFLSDRSADVPAFFGRKELEDQLQKKNEEAAMLHEFMLDREVKMTELKQEIAHLNTRLGIPIE